MDLNGKKCLENYNIILGCEYLIILRSYCFLSVMMVLWLCLKKRSVFFNDTTEIFIDKTMQCFGMNVELGI